MKKITVILSIATLLLLIISSNYFSYAVSSTDISSADQSYSSFREYSDENTRKVDTTLKVYDYADLINDVDEIQLRDSIEQFINEYRMDMVVVTINENNKASSMAYADDFYDYNGFGIGTSHDGILFLIDMDNRKMWISTTGKAIRIYNDARIDTILDYTYNKIKNQEYGNCAKEFVRYAKYFAKKGVSGSDTVPSVPYMVAFSSLFGVLGAIAYAFIGVSSLKTVRKQKMAQNYIRNFHITGAGDTYSHKNVTRTYNPRSSDSGGGSSFGGSSTHIGSSGISHGGGGRSF